MLKDDIRLILSGIPSDAAAELLDGFGSASAIFDADKEEILAVKELSTRTLNRLLSPADDKRIEKELEFIERYSIRPISYVSSEYSQNLAAVFDPPSTLFVKGAIDFNDTPSKWIGIVGTRKCSPYGVSCVERLVAEIAERHPDAVIVSGLAYGIDSYAHRAAVKCGLKSVGVFAHGLDTIYPNEHRDLAKKMIDDGGAVATEYLSECNITKYNFLKRNRIVAGLCSALIMAESPEKGGSMVTASIADGYGRDIFSFPARITDRSFSGNLQLLRSNKANILTSIKDIEYVMGWQEVVREKSLDITQHILSDTEQQIFELFRDGETITADEILESTTLAAMKIMSGLTSLEFKGLIKSVKGKMYIKL